MFEPLANLRRQVKLTLSLFGSHFLSWFPKSYFPYDACSVPKNKKERHFCVFYLSSVGSLGDAAMGYSIVTQIREKFPSARITFLIHRDDDRQFFEQFKVETVSLQGYFSIIPQKSAARNISRVLETCTHFIIPGADVVDGVYSKGGTFRRLFSGVMAEKIGAKVHVVGFSFSGQAPEATRKLFRERCQGFDIVCRDPVSAERLSEIMGRKIPYGADLAFLLPIGERCLHPAAQVAEDMVAQGRLEKRPVVIFNANPLSFQNALPDVSRPKVVSVLAKALDEFSERTGAAILFLTHDNRKSHSDARFLREIIDSLETDFPRCFVPETVQPTDIKRLCKLSDLVVTGRMHLGIAGLGSGKATMITDYQGKVQGLYSLFGISDLALDLSEIIHKETRLADVMEATLKNRSYYENEIESSLPAIKALSRKNLENIWCCDP